MSLQFLKGNITRLKVDAIVNAANTSLLGGGGLDGAIHRAAGPELLAECRKIGGLSTGKAVATGAYKLPAKYVIHTVGPIYVDGHHGEEALLRSAYRESLLKAAEKECETIAFPLISAGIYGYPKDEVVKIAVSEIKTFLETHEMNVTLVFFTGADEPPKDVAPAELREMLAAFAAAKKPADAPLFDKVKEAEDRRNGFFYQALGKKPKTAKKEEEITCAVECSIDPDFQPISATDLDESFQEMLLRLIDERGLTDAECYKKANLDRRLFSKIRSDRLYQPKKPTAVAFCIALKLSLPEAEDLLKKAGFALSTSNYFDMIIRYCIEKKIYDVNDVNIILFRYDQVQLGATVR